MTESPRPPDWTALAAYGDAALALLARDLRVPALPCAAPAPRLLPTAGTLATTATTAVAAGAARLPGLACLLGAVALLLLAWLLELRLRRGHARDERDAAERALVARHARARGAARTCRALGLPATAVAVEAARAGLADGVITPLARTPAAASPAPAAVAS